MSLEADEDEHSIEMHLPYVAKVRYLGDQNSTTYPLFTQFYGNANSLYLITSMILGDAKSER